MQKHTPVVSALWEHTPVVSALGKWTQEHWELKVTLSYIRNPRPA